MIPCRDVKRTHGIEGFLRDPADVHVVHVASALLYLHRNSPLLKIEKYHALINKYRAMIFFREEY